MFNGEKDSTIIHLKKWHHFALQLFYAKIGSKTHLVFEKWHHFENWPNIAKQNGQEWFILGRSFKEPKAHKSDSAIVHLNNICNFLTIIYSTSPAIFVKTEHEQKKHVFFIWVTKFRT